LGNTQHRVVEPHDAAPVRRLDACRGGVPGSDCRLKLIQATLAGGMCSRETGQATTDPLPVPTRSILLGEYDQNAVGIDACDASCIDEKRESHLRLHGKGRVATTDQQRQLLVEGVVVVRHFAGSPGGAVGGVYRHKREERIETLCSPDSIDRLASRRGQEPGSGGVSENLRATSVP